MKLVECINDTGYKEEHLKWIKNFPIRSEIYTVKTKVVYNGEIGYVLEEIDNPPMPNGYLVNFHHKRFKDIKSDLDIEQLLEQIKIVENFENI